MKRFRRFFALFFALSFIAAIGVGTANARPGGGGSFRGSSSGSSRSSGGGGGGSSRSSGGGYSGGYGGGYSGGYGGTTVVYGDGGGGFAALFVIMIIIVIIFVIVRARVGQRASDWNTTRRPDDDDSPGPQFRRSARATLETLSNVDPNFSIVVFEDFVYALYTEVHTARGKGQLAKLTAYLGPQALGALQTGDLAEVRTIVIGAMRVAAATMANSPDDAVRTTIELEANYAEVNQRGHEQAFYVCERWSLIRRAGTLSRTPQKARVIACPSCGAPIEGVVQGRCRYCSTDVCTGSFDWVVEGIEIVSREARGPMLTEETREEGTNLPTIRDPGAEQTLASLGASDPAFAWPTIQSRVTVVFEEFQRAWAARDLEAMRPLMSETLFQTQTYWIETYLRQGLRNITEKAHIDRMELVRVNADRFFDAVTVRIFASSLDYTIADADGRVVTGSKTFKRAYSEYWTLIRGRAQKGAASADNGKQCPNCGAPLTINMGGACTYCKANVSSGEFNWVLSRIEQDEVYIG